ncbi:hypothetical protein EDB86DRAFT_2824550 [Lactarius hatsudake]|nr:hypothetical protein EDB86DRAFT_2824550 [Lactarius hatsudake]
MVGALPTVVGELLLSEGQHMVVNLEYVIPATPVNTSSPLTLSEVIDYTATVTDWCNAIDVLLEYPCLDKAYASSSIFMVEAKALNLSDHVPQAIGEMYTCGRFLQ